MIGAINESLFALISSVGGCWRFDVKVFITIWRLRLYLDGKSEDIGTYFAVGD